MTRSLAVLAFALVSGSCHLLFSQDANKPGILGYLDPQTGAFRPIGQKAPQTTAASPAPTTGTLVVNITITIQSSIPANANITCSVQGSVNETVSVNPYEYNFMSESASTTATRSGSSASCSLTIPYSWILSTPARDMVNVSYTISAFGTGVTPTLSSRYSTAGIATVGVPANGTTTTENLAATI